MSKLRTSELAKILGMNTATPIHNAEANDQAPYWETDYSAGGQRRYTGEHALAWLLAELLRGQGLSVGMAGAAVARHSKVIALFLNDVEAQQPSEHLFVLDILFCVEDSLTGGHRWESQGSYGDTQASVQGQMVVALGRAGEVVSTRNGRTQERKVAGPWVAVASIPEAYRLLCQRAREAGYVVAGRSVLKIAAEISTEQDEA